MADKGVFSGAKNPFCAGRLRERGRAGGPVAGKAGGRNFSDQVLVERDAVPVK